jgi:hypothetical protein
VDITEKLERVAEHKVDILAKALVCYEAKAEIERLRAIIQNAALAIGHDDSPLLKEYPEIKTAAR